MKGQKVTYPKYKIKGVIVHHSAGDWTFDQVNNHHKDIWGAKSSLGYYVGYHKVIDLDGTLHIARRDGEEGAHAVGGIPHYYNRYYVGICLQGNFEEREPTGEQLRVLEKELDKYRRVGLEILMHRQVSATLCPGKHLIEWLQAYKKYGK